MKDKTREEIRDWADLVARWARVLHDRLGDQAKTRADNDEVFSLFNTIEYNFEKLRDTVDDIDED